MFPDQGGYSTPTFGEKADIIRSEFDQRAPKLRLSVFAYLVEAGIKPKDIDSTDAFMQLLSYVTEYVSADTENYAAALEELEPAVSAEAVALLDDIDGENPYGSGGGGYE